MVIIKKYGIQVHHKQLQVMYMNLQVFIALIYFCVCCFFFVLAVDAILRIFLIYLQGCMVVFVIFLLCVPFVVALYALVFSVVFDRFEIYYMRPSLDWRKSMYLKKLFRNPKNTQ